jgi:hypothetical protein
MSDVTINCGNALNDDTTVQKSDKVTFHNSLNNKSIALVLPANQGGNSCFAGNPTSPVNIAAGDSSTKYTINNNANGNYNYSWTVENDPSAAPRTGRIIVD